MADAMEPVSGAHGDVKVECGGPEKCGSGRDASNISTTRIDQGAISRSPQNVITLSALKLRFFSN